MPGKPDIPEWAIEEFCKRTGIDRHFVMIGGTQFASTRNAIREGGRLIAEHEEPPVDPLLVEAREIAAAPPRTTGLANEFRAGKWDESCDVQLALRALKRGMELSREK